MKIWNPLEHTADFAFRIFGKNISDLFQNARTAFYEIIFEELPEVEKVESQIIELNSPDQSLLLIDFLRELLFLLIAEGVIVESFRIIKLNTTTFQAECNLLKIQEITKEPFIKAITYHNSQILEKNGLLQIDVVCDV